MSPLMKAEAESATRCTSSASSSFVTSPRAMRGNLPLLRQLELEVEPAGQVLDLAIDRGRHRLAERLVLMDGRHFEHPSSTVGPRVKLPDQPVAVEDRQGVVTPSPLG